MGALPNNAQEQIRNLLQTSVIRCSERCLYQSAKWAAELLNSFPEPEPVSPSDTEPISPMEEDAPDQRISSVVISQNADSREARLEASEIYKYLLAKSFFDCREYDRCSAVFLPMTLPKGETQQEDLTRNSTDNQSHKSRMTASGPDPSSVSLSSGFPHLSQKALFLALYAKYMAGEKRRDEETELILGKADSGAVVNRELVGISQALEGRFEWQEMHGIQGQGWLEYLFGIILAKGKNDGAARTWLLRSINLNSFNWGAWQELTSLISNVDELHKTAEHVPQDIMTFVFNVYANQELHHTGDEVMQALDDLERIFPRSSFLRSQKALLHYHDKDFDKAEQKFSKILQTDPLRLEDMDTYSNILYVMEKRAKLAYLAQLTTSIEQFRPETCCVVGNYHAMKSEHEKAITFFRRALVLDRNFAAAWTLMGHEYVELKNTQTAIACYRQAVDINRKDFRAWYGLGQTYEILEMHNHSLYYYKRAADLAPLDPKMWSAVANVYNKINHHAEAIKAFKRCLSVGSPLDSMSSFGSSTQRSQHGGARPMDPDILFAIAELYERLGQKDESRAWMEICLAQEEGIGDEEAGFGASVNTSMGTNSSYHGTGVTPTTSKARMWLAKHYLKHGRDNQEVESLRKAHVLANELCQDGFEVEEAKALIKTIRSMLGADAALAMEA